jgi:iron complex outermembrane receptor protein
MISLCSWSDTHPVPRRRSIAFAVALALLGTGPRAFSLDDRPTATGVELEEIVVTATKREENVEKVPISVYALSQNDLTLANAKNMDDIAALSPGIEFDNYSGYATSTLTLLSIRGRFDDGRLHRRHRGPGAHQ